MKKVDTHSLPYKHCLPLEERAELNIIWHYHPSQSVTNFVQLVFTALCV